MSNKKTSSITELLIWIPVIAMIIFIFVMSLQPGEISYSSSGAVAEKVAKVTFLGIDLTHFADSPEELDRLNSMIRMVAHVAEYGCLAIAVSIAVTVCGVRRKLRLFYTLAAGLFVSLADEFLQVFVPGRYGDFIDIVSDMSGTIIIGGLVFICGRRVYNDSFNRLSILNVSVDNVDFDQALSMIMEFAKNRNRHYIVTPNADHIVKLEKDDEFVKCYENASLVTVDGSPIMWIAESFGYKLKQRVTGSDLLPLVCERAGIEKKSVFILGAEDEVAKKAASILMERYEGLNICGTYSPAFGFEDNEEEIGAIINRVNEASPDILVLSLGSPKQEKFIYRYREQMNFGVALPFGAAVDFVAGNVRRAPLWLRKTGLEWLFRFLQEPGRLFKRYFIDDTGIFILAWKYRHSAEVKDENTI